MRPTLICFAGLPGTGKTTIAKSLARETGAAYLRVDEIEAAMLRQDPARELGPAGYEIAAALAVSNLELGRDAIVDCVNPWALTRAMFADAARRANAAFLGVEVVCGDPALHRERLESRTSDIAGLPPVDWAKVVARDYHPWDDADFRIDTARLTPAAAIKGLLFHRRGDASQA